jgi:hypothetical protein
VSDYVKHGHRVSLLPFTQYCGAAGELSEMYGAGRPAAMSSAFHAQQAGAPNAATLLALLSDEERQEIAAWKKPAPVYMTEMELGHFLLDYDKAEKEVALGLDDFGFYVDPTTGEDCLTIGHMDMGWVVANMAYVGDIKKTEWTAAEGPDSPQLHAYGWAFAQKHGCRSYCTGIWLATEGEWLWSNEPVVLDSPRGQEIWDRISAAAGNFGQASTGTHCRGCYARLHCPEHMLPAALVDTWLAPVVDGAPVPTDDEALEFVLKLEATIEVAKKAKEHMKELVRRGKVRVARGGKAWLPVEMKGRESVSTEDLRTALGADAEKYIHHGKSFTQMRWLRTP